MIDQNFTLNHLTSFYIFMTSMVHINRIIDNILPIIQFLLHTLFSYNMYIIENKELKIKIIKNMTNYYGYCYDENKDPIRFIFDKRILPRYFTYIECPHDDCVTLFCNLKTYQLLTQDDYTKQHVLLDENMIPLQECHKTKNELAEIDSDSDEETKNHKCDELLGTNNIKYLTLNGSFGHFFVNERNINLSQIQVNEWYDYQTELFRKIMTFYKKNNYCKIFLNGPPGKGKTYMAYLMAYRLNCYLTDQYNPTDPGSSLSCLYHRAKQIGPAKPFIIVLDEVDIMLDKIHNNKVQQHKHFKSEINDKTTWNQFIDRINYGLFPYLIVFMISNKQIDEINSMDKSYLRDGRIDIVEKW